MIDWLYIKVVVEDTKSVAETVMAKELIVEIIIFDEYTEKVTFVWEVAMMDSEIGYLKIAIYFVVHLV